MITAPRPWVMKLNVQRVRTTSRFSNPIRYWEMHRQPGEPRHEAAQPDMLDVGHGACAPDRGEVALVVVAEAS
jgi:hypothetical protein